MTVGVMIASTFRDLVRLAALLEDLERQTRPPDEVLITVQAKGAALLQAEDVLARFRHTLPMRIVAFPESGLSRNRNRGLKLARSDVCLLCDDDLHLDAGAIETVASAFTEIPEAVIITFRIQSEGRPAPDKASSPRRHNWRSIATVASPEIAIWREWVQSEGLRFDERFGLGTERWRSGEENVFLRDALRKSRNVYTIPTKIGEHPAQGSAQALDAQALVGKGAVFARMYGRIAGPPLLAAFLVKKALQTRLPLNLVTIRSALRGFREFFRA